jgi:hypothetical protein
LMICLLLQQCEIHSIFPPPFFYFQAGKQTLVVNF